MNAVAKSMRTVKFCSKCNTTKSITEFYKQGNRTTWRCKPCYNAYIKDKKYSNYKEFNRKRKYNRDKNKEYINAQKREYYAKNREKIVQQDRTCRERLRPQRRRWQLNAYYEFRKWYDALREKPCMDCKEIFPYYCMDWDHIGPKKYGLSSMVVARNKEKILEELKNCELVCANCHRIRTQKRLHEKLHIQKNKMLLNAA